MYKNQKKQLYKRIDKLISKGEIGEENDIYIFGINDPAREMISYLRSKNVVVKAILDNNPKRQHIYCSGVKSIGLNEVSDLKDRNNRFLIYSGFWREMVKELLALGVEREIIFLMFTRNPIKETFLYRMYYVWSGKRIYWNIVKKYPRSDIFLCPYTGTGDIYLIGTLFEDFRKKNNIVEPVFLVANAACGKVSKIFCWENVVVLKDLEDVSKLLSYYMLCPNECNMTVLNDGWGEIHTNGTEWLRNYKGLNFADMFKLFVFDLDKSAKPIIPHIKDDIGNVEKIFRDNDLKIGKTVILSPFSNTLSDMPTYFWEDLANKLKNIGLDVCTNCGSKTEMPLNGTKAVFFPLDIAPLVIESAGYFIGIRSGFCDIVSGAKAKKVVLYDKYNHFYNDTAYKYFSLSIIGLCEDALEIEFDIEKLDITIEEIIYFFEGGNRIG